MNEFHSKISFHDIYPLLTSDFPRLSEFDYIEIAILYYIFSTIAFLSLKADQKNLGRSKKLSFYKRQKIEHLIVIFLDS